MRISLVILLLSCFSLSLSAQGRCGTIQTEQMSLDLQTNRENFRNNPNKSKMTRFIPVTFFVVGDSNGAGRMPESEVYRGLCQLNQRYEDNDADMIFYAKELVSIDNENIYNDPRNNEGLMRSYKDASSMNFFIINDIPGSNPSAGSTLAYYSPSRDIIVCRKANFGDATFTIEHEIGHFFTLKHTHYGWEDEPYSFTEFGEKIDFRILTGSSQTPFGVNINVELEDRTNCENGGDDVCDTPPDYGLGFTCGCCRMSSPILDPNCDTITTMMDNIMSYSGSCDTYRFTPGQIEVMHGSHAANNRAYLRADIAYTEYKPVSDQTVTLSPVTLEIVEPYDDVTFRWEPTENAEFYTILINGEAFNTTETEFRYFDLPPNSFINTYSVKAFGPFGGGCGGVTEVLFSTGNSTATSNIDFVSKFSAYPNPITSGTLLNLSFQSDKALDAEVLLFDLQGRMVLNKKVTFVNGHNDASLNLSEVSKGLHLLEIKTSEGSITEKIIVE